MPQKAPKDTQTTLSCEVVASGLHDGSVKPMDAVATIATVNNDICPPFLDTAPKHINFNSVYSAISRMTHMLIRELGPRHSKFIPEWNPS